MNEDFDRILRFLRSVDLLDDLPLEILKQHQFSCSEHNYRSGSVIVNNSNESEWIYVVKSGSCDVYKTVKSKPKQTRRKHVPNDVTSDTRGRMFPPIKTRSEPILKKKPSFRESLDARNETLTSSLQLPKIKRGDEKRLVGHTLSLSDSGYGSTHSDDEMKLTKKKQKHSKGIRTSDGERFSSSTTFLRLDTLQAGGVFGLQALLDQNPPSLSLISNGAECVLISKQFILDKLSSAALQRLKQKVTPCCSHSQSTNAPPADTLQKPSGH